MADSIPDQTAELMTIGVFSRATLLTTKALRNYHRSGLLVPAQVDPNTGYRAYHVGQLADAAVIRKLRTLEVSLEDITAIMGARDPEVTAKVLGQHLAIMEDRLAATRTIVDELLVGNEQPATLTPPTIIEVDHTDVVSIVGTVAREAYADFLGRSFDLLLDILDDAGVAPTGAAGASYPPMVDDTEEVTAFVPIAEPFDMTGHVGCEVTELAARRVASITHQGDYDDIGDTYRALGRWVALNAEPLDEPIREHYLVSYNETSDPSAFVTEIHWPIKDRKHT
jgi:DNA-binding transcriptional MerR regulator